MVYYCFTNTRLFCSSSKLLDPLELDAPGKSRPTQPKIALVSVGFASSPDEKCPRLRWMCPLQTSVTVTLDPHRKGCWSRDVARKVKKLSHQWEYWSTLKSSMLFSDFHGFSILSTNYPGIGLLPISGKPTKNIYQVWSHSYRCSDGRLRLDRLGWRLRKGQGQPAKRESKNRHPNMGDGRISAWWLTYPSEKYEFVSWDYYSQYVYVYIYIEK